LKFLDLKMSTVPIASVPVIRDLFRHMEWADATVWRAVLSHTPAQADDVLRGYLAHLHTVQRAALRLWQGQTHEQAYRNVLDTDACVNLHQSVQPYYSELRTFLDTLDEATLARPLVMPWLKPYEEKMGMTFATPMVGETMLHVTIHSTYHRGQVNARLRATGGEPPHVDYIAWIWFERPAPDWNVLPA
jgi:uncharacterized damage-inducible protein DinB